MTINSFTVFDNYKNIIFEQKNIKNIVHQLGEQYMLNALFKQGDIASSYWVGLDNRVTLGSTDTVASITGEPLPQTSYKRQEITSWSSPYLLNGSYAVKSSSIVFDASLVGWGPVNNIFLTTSKSGGILVSSARLSQTVALTAGDSVIMDMSLSLTN
jgi:hypothetical protein